MKIIAALSLIALVSACGPGSEPESHSYASPVCCVVCNASVADPCVDACVPIGSCDTTEMERTDGAWCACSAD